ncbi:hypothetical protein TNCV_4528361 [Trichonephila clavipes]|nr:hypothetical protein TNCV_4528361 [Trichonephila clavipes]
MRLSDLFSFNAATGTNYSNSFPEWPPPNVGNKVSPTCVRCSAYLETPELILDCLGLSIQDPYEDPLMILDFLRVNEIMDLV